jgi:ABC-type polysaccharide/polyol phosphate export permease
MLQGSWLRTVIEVNPLTPLVRLVQDPVAGGRVPSAGTFAAALVAALATCLAAAFTVSRYEKRVIFHM